RHLLALALASCATAPAAPGSTPLDAKATLAVAGPRCDGPTCRCREPNIAGGEGAIAPGQKRFELRTSRGVDPMTVTVEGRGTFVRPVGAREVGCAYIDLPPGRHPVRI